MSIEYPEFIKKRLLALWAPLTEITVISFIIGFLVYMLNQNIIDFIHRNFIHGPYEALLLHIPALDFIYNYTQTHNTADHWRRVAVFYGSHMLLLPFIIHFIYGFLGGTPSLYNLLSQHKHAPELYKTPRQTLAIMIFLVFILLVTLKFFLLPIFLIDATNQSGEIHECTGRGCTMLFLTNNLLHMDSGAFLILPLSLGLGLLMLAFVVFSFVFSAALMRNFYDKVPPENIEPPQP